MTGNGGRGVAAFIADWQKTALILLIRPRGSGVAEAARSAMITHPLSAHLSLTLEAVDSWEAAFGRLQRLLPAYLTAARGPLLTLAQTPRSATELFSLAPALRQLPLIEVPHHGRDGDWGATRLLGAGWQSIAVSRALDRYMELGGWWTEKLAMSRYTNVPIGLLARPNPSAYAADVAFQRRLLATGHLSWASETATPDLGGVPPDGWFDEEELANPETEAPGMYRSMYAYTLCSVMVPRIRALSPAEFQTQRTESLMATALPSPSPLLDEAVKPASTTAARPHSFLLFRCITLSLERLAVNTLIRSKHVHDLDGLETVRTTSLTGLPSPYSFSALCPPIRRFLCRAA